MHLKDFASCSLPVFRATPNSFGCILLIQFALALMHRPPKPNATVDDGSCVSCTVASTFCGIGTIWDAQAQRCIGDGNRDINLDGCVLL